MNSFTEEEIADLRSKWPKCVTRPQDAHCSFLMEQREINFQPRYEDENPRKNEIENWKPPIVKDYEVWLMKDTTPWKTETVFVQTEDRLKWVCQLLRTSKEIAVDIKWDEENSFLYSMSLLTIAIPTHTFVFDPYPLHLQIIEYLKPIFEDTAVIKLFHGHQSHTLKLQACFHIYPAGIIDTQVVQSFIYKSLVSFTYTVFYHLGESFATTINKDYKWADCRARLEPPTEEKFLPTELEKCCCINAQLLLRVWCFQKQGIESYAKLNKVDPEEVLRMIYNSSKESLTAKFTNEDFRKYVSSNYEVTSSDFTHYGLESFHQQQSYIEMLNWRMEQAKVCDTSPSQIITNLDLALIVKNDPKTTQEFCNKLAKGEDVMPLIAKQVNSILPISRDGQIDDDKESTLLPKKEMTPVKFTLSAIKCLLPNPAPTNVESLKPVGKSFLPESSNRKPASPEKNYLKVPGFKVLPMPILPSVPVKNELPILSESASNLNSIPLIPKAVENVQHIPPLIPLPIYYKNLHSASMSVRKGSSTINNILPVQASRALQFNNKELSTFVDKAITQARSIEYKWNVEKMTHQNDLPSEKDRTSRDCEDLTSRKDREDITESRKSLTTKAREDRTTKVHEDLKPKVQEDLTPKVREDLTPKVLEDLTPKVREDLKPKVCEDLTPKVCKDLTPKVNKDLTPKVSKDLTPKVREDLKPKVCEDIMPKVNKDLTPKVSEDLTSKVSEDLKPKVREDLTPKVSEDLKPKVREDISSKVSEDVTLKLRKNVTSGVCKDVTSSVRKNATSMVCKDARPTVSKDVIPTVSKDVVPKVRKDVSPTELKDVIPAVLKDVIPAVLKDVIPAVRKDLTSRVQKKIGVWRWHLRGKQRVFDEDRTSGVRDEYRTSRVRKDRTSKVRKNRTSKVRKNRTSRVRDEDRTSRVGNEDRRSMRERGGHQIYSSRVNEEERMYSSRVNEEDRMYSSRVNKEERMYSSRVNEEDRMYSSRVNEEDRMYSSRVNEEDRMYSSRVNEEDRMYSSRVNEEDRMYSSRVNEEDRMYSSRVNEEERMYSSRVNEEDRMYSSRGHEEERMYSSRVNEEDRMHLSRVHEEDRIYSSRVNEGDQMYSSRVHKEDRMHSSRVREDVTRICRDPKPGRRNIINVVGEEGRNRSAGGEFIFRKNNRAENNDVICDHCNKVGHLIEYCRKRIKGLPPYYVQSNSHNSSRNNDLSARKRFRPRPYERPPVHFSPPPDRGRPGYYSSEFMSNTEQPALMDLDFQEDHLFRHGESLTPNRRWH